MQRSVAASRTARRRLDRRLLGLAVVTLAALCACDVRRSETEPIAECIHYAERAQACLGDRLATRLRATFAKPPEAAEARAALREQCLASETQLRRTCR